MGIRAFIQDMLGISKEVPLQSILINNEVMGNAIKEIAFMTCTERISKAIGSCKFNTYQDGQEVEGDVWYQLNYEPNQNQNKTNFLQKLISQLYKENEALVIKHGDELLVADSFQANKRAITPNFYKDVVVEGYKFTQIFFESDVLHFELANQNIKTLLEGFYKSHGEILSVAGNSYKQAKGEKGVLEISTIAKGQPNFAKEYEQLVNHNFKNYFTNPNAVLPMFEGMKYSPNQQKTYSSEGTRDIKALYDDVFDIYARAFCLPPSLIKGSVQDTSSAVDELLTFCINPLVEMLQSEFNRKLYGGGNIKKKTYLKIDTSTIKFIDIFNISKSVDKLINCGIYSINDVKKKLGEPAINEEWADTHFITKNYSEIDEEEKGAED